MYSYIVTCKPVKESEPGAFVEINFGRDGFFDFDDFDSDGNEVYTVKSEHDISRQLDLSDGVISYTEIN